jgi:hypothetical protein
VASCGALGGHPAVCSVQRLRLPADSSAADEYIARGQLAEPFPPPSCRGADVITVLDTARPNDASAEGAGAFTASSVRFASCV